MLRHACRLSLEGLVSKRRRRAYPRGRGPAPGSSRNARRGRSSSSPATCPRRCRATSSARWCSATTRTARSCMSAASAPASAGRWPRTLAERLKALARKDAALRRQARRRRGARRHLGQARARGGGRVPRLDRRRHPAPRCLPRPARRQAGARDRPRGRRRQGWHGRGQAEAPAGQAHPSRPRLLAGRRRHQAGPRRLLRRGLAADGAASSSTARSRSCAARAGPRASASSRSTPGRGTARRSSPSTTRRTTATSRSSRSTACRR